MADFGLWDEGAGEPVIWLHSSGTSKRQWRRMIDGLPSGYRSLALDLLGYGETPMPAEAQGFSLVQEAALVERLFERFEGTCRLVGHSYGGAVALKVAQRNPGRVQSVFAYEPVLFHLLDARAEAAAEREEIHAVSRQTTSLAAAGNLEGAAEVFVRYWNGDIAWDVLSPERRSQLAAVASKAAYDFAAIDRETDPPAAYLAVGASVRIACGELSPAPARKVAAILGKAQPEALETLPGVGHMAPITHPAPVREAILRHWNGAVRPASDGFRPA